MLVSELEQRLLEAFPAETAEGWDRTGMLVGDPADEVRGVAVALDPTRQAIAHAVEAGANVLVTHHPLFLDPPPMVQPAAPAADAVGARIWDAVKAGVSVLSFHTALDANPKAAAVLAGPLELNPPVPEPLEPVAGHPGFGYGRICHGRTRRAAWFARASREAFGGAPRLWGDPAREVDTVCLWTGSAGDAPFRCLERGIGLLVCGEVRYHTALDACERGLCIVELGHDVSEQVHCPVLVQSIADAGVPAQRIHLMDLPANWRAYA